MESKQPKQLKNKRKNSKAPEFTPTINNDNDNNNKNDSLPRSASRKSSSSSPTSPSFSSSSQSTSPATSTCLTFRTTLVLVAAVAATFAEISLLVCLLIHGQLNVAFLEPNLVGERAKNTAAQIESFVNRTVDAVSDTRYEALEMGLPFASFDASNGTNNVSVQNLINLISTHSMLVGDEFGRILFCRYHDGSFGSSGSSGPATRIQVHRSNVTWQSENAAGSAPETPHDIFQVRFNLTSLTTLPPAAPIAPTSSTFVDGIFWKTGKLIAEDNRSLLANLPLELSYTRFYSEGSFFENLFFPIAAAGFSPSYSATDPFVNCGSFLQFLLLGSLLRQHLIGGTEGRAFMVGRNNNLVVANSYGPSYSVTNYTDLGGVWQGCYRGGDLVACFFNVSDHPEYSMLVPALEALPTRIFFGRLQPGTVSKDDLSRNIHHHSATVTDPATSIEYLAHGVRLRSSYPTFFFVVYYLIPSDYYLRDITSARNVAIGLSIGIFVVGATGAYFILGLAASAVESLAARMQDPWGFHEVKEEKKTFDATAIRNNKRENDKKKKKKKNNNNKQQNDNINDDDDNDNDEDENNIDDETFQQTPTSSKNPRTSPVVVVTAASSSSSTFQLWKYFKELATIEAQFSIFRMHIENLRGFTRFQLASMNNLDANKNKFEHRRRGANNSSSGNTEADTTTGSDLSELSPEGSSALGSFHNGNKSKNKGSDDRQEFFLKNDNENKTGASGSLHSAASRTEMFPSVPQGSSNQENNNNNNNDGDVAPPDSRAALGQQQSEKIIMTPVTSEPSLLDQLNAHTADHLEKIEENPEKASELIHRAMLQNQLQLQQQQEKSEQELIGQQQRKEGEADVQSKNSKKKKSTETGSNNNNNNNNNNHQCDTVPPKKSKNVPDDADDERDPMIATSERRISTANVPGDEHLGVQPNATPTAVNNRKKVSFATSAAAAEAAEANKSSADASIDDADYKILQESEEIYKNNNKRKKQITKNVKLEGRNFHDDAAKNDGDANAGQILQLLDDDDDDDDGEDHTTTSTTTASSSHDDDDDDDGVVNDDNNHNFEHKKHDKNKKGGKRMATTPKQDRSKITIPSSPSYVSPSPSQGMKIQNQFYEKFCCVCFHFNFYDIIEFLGNEQSDSFSKSQHRCANSNNCDNSSGWKQIPESSSSSLPTNNNKNNNNKSTSLRKNRPDLRKSRLNDYYKSSSFEKQQQHQQNDQQHWTGNAEICAIVYEKLIEVINAAATLVHDAIVTSGATLIEFDGDTILCCIRLRSLYKKSRIFIRLMNQITEIFMTAATLSSTESGKNCISSNNINNNTSNCSKIIINDGERVSLSGITKQYQRPNIDELGHRPTNDDTDSNNINNNNNKNNGNNNILDEQSRAKLKLLEAIRRVNVAIGCSVGGLKTIQVDMSSGGGGSNAGSRSSVAGLARPVTFLGPAVGNCCKVATFLVNLHRYKDQAEKAKLYLVGKNGLAESRRGVRALKGNSSIKNTTNDGQRSTTTNGPTHVASVVCDGNDVISRNADDVKPRNDTLLFTKKKEEAKKRVNGNDDDDHEGDDSPPSRDETFTNENFLIGVSHAMSTLFEPDFVTAAIIGHVRMTDDLMTLTATDDGGGKQKDMAEIVRIVPLQSGFMYRTTSKSH